jgi:predicted nucleotidyltransferase
MHLDPDKKLAGYPQIEIRDLLRKSNKELDKWQLSFIEEGLSTFRDEAIKLVKELESRNLIQDSGRKIYKSNPRDFQREELIIWELTDKGRRFAKASTERISRDEADRIIRSLLKQIDQANQNPEFTYIISQALVFGSYITDIQCLSDVDIALELTPKEQDPQKQTTREKARRDQAQASGKLNSYPDWEVWPKQEIYNFLQEEIGHLDFDTVAFVLASQLPHKNLYPIIDETITF